MPTSASGSPADAPTRARAATDADALLQRLAGPAARLRPDQARALEALAHERRRVLLVQATGWGKSAVYWLATALRRAEGAGPTLVVSPLLALMRDQVDAARRLGLRAETINSSNLEAWEDITTRLAADAVDVLLISPERLNAPGFRSHLGALAPRLGMLVVDEAHCISDWGHDFRPDYRRIGDVLAGLPEGTPVLACTATANTRVTEDVAAQLGTGTLVLRGRLARDSLRLAVVNLPRAERRLAWLEAYVRGHAARAGARRAGIVYALTVADAHRVATHLRARGLSVASYASDVDPAERQRIEHDLLHNRVDAVVSTSALGMGYDKPDLAFVVHLGAPSSPVSYYQQVGRAGRAIDEAEVVLLPTAHDEAIWRHFDLAGIPTRAEATAILDALDADRPTTLPALERAVNARRSRMELLLKVLDVDGAVARVEGGWVATGRTWRYDEERYDRLADLRRSEHEAMRLLCRGGDGGCLMRLLTAQLDDPEADPCGRCGGCTGWAPEVAVEESAVTAARSFLRSSDIPVHPRRQWPPGLADRRGRIPAELRHEVGRALAAGAESGWGEVVDRLLAPEAGADRDAALAEVVEGIVAVLARWTWAQRPAAVVPVPSRTQPVVLAEVCAAIGRLGRLPVLPAVRRATDAPPQSAMANSTHLARNALAAYEVDPEVPLPDGPLLLVDLRSDSGWTLTAVAARLREAGGGPVLPLVLATRP
jgi:ATP-dependent DNA helicase RecQ